MLVLFALIAAALIVGAIFRYPLVTDDPFITYRYAHNLIQGNGFVYNPGEHVLSTTTPLYTLLLAALGLFAPDIPTLGFWLSVIGLGVCAWFVYLITCETLASASVPSVSKAEPQDYAAGILAALVVLVSPALVITFGLETGFYLALACAAFYFYLRGRVNLSFALLALLTLTRNDGILFAIILGAHYLATTVYSGSRFTPRTSFVRTTSSHSSFSIFNIRHSLFLPFIIYLLILAPWLIFAWAWFGSPFPFTLTAKIAQAQSGLWDPFAVGLFKYARDVAVWLLPLVLFGVVGAVWAWQHARRSLLLALWAVAHLVAYSLLGVAFYAWYVAPLLPALALFAAFGVWQGAHRLGAQLKKPNFAFPIIVVGGLVLIALEFRADVDAGMMRPSPKVEAYQRAANWIATNTPPASSVDALEVGIIGYNDARRTLDFVGLVDPARISYLRTTRFADGVRRAAADYVIAIPPDSWLPSDVWFPNAYRAVQRIRVPGFYGDKPLVIYERADAGRAVVESHPINLSFENKLDLNAADFFTRTIQRGDILPLRLELQARSREPLPEEWKFTLQLVGANNHIVAQTDNFYPARLPEDGAPFTDYQGIPIPQNAPPGEYDLILAMYNAKDGERLSLYDANGSEIGDFLPLGKIAVEK